LTDCIIIYHNMPRRIGKTKKQEAGKMKGGGEMKA
jgi:hypothetical protein